MVLAAVAAEEAGQFPIAKFCRQMATKNNPGHIIARFETVREAQEDAEFNFFLSKLERRFEFAEIETEFAAAKLDWENDYDQSPSLESYFSSILNVDYNWIVEHFE